MVSFVDVGKMWDISFKFRRIHNLLKTPHKDFMFTVFLPSIVI